MTPIDKIYMVMYITLSNDKTQLTISTNKDETENIIKIEPTKLYFKDSYINYNHTNKTIDIISTGVPEKHGPPQQMTFTKIIGNPIKTTNNILKMNGNWIVTKITPKNQDNESFGLGKVHNLTLINDKVIKMVMGDGFMYAIITNMTNNSIKIEFVGQWEYTLKDDNTIGISVAGIELATMTRK